RGAKGGDTPDRGVMLIPVVLHGLGLIRVGLFVRHLLPFKHPSCTLSCGPRLCQNVGPRMPLVRLRPWQTTTLSSRKTSSHCAGIANCCSSRSGGARRRSPVLKNC